MIVQTAPWVMGSIGLAVLLVWVPFLYPWARPFSTFVHESGHAVVALLTGQYVEALRIVSKGGGCTSFEGEGRLAHVLVFAAGYLAPPGAGLALIAAVHAGVSPRSVLLVVLVLPIVMLLVAETGFTRLVIVAVIAVLAILIHHAGPVSQTAAIVTAGLVLILAGIRSISVLLRVDLTEQDPGVLQDRTGIPAAVWIVLFAAFAGFCLYLAGRWLLTEPWPGGPA